MSTVWNPSALPGHAAMETQKTREVSKYPKWEGVTLAGLLLAVSLVLGFQLLFRYHILYGDALSRVLNGMYTVLRPGFHLAAVGFLWNPLPALLAIPLAEFRLVWPPIMEYGYASNIISACFAAVGVYHMNRLLWRFGFARTARILWCLLYVANPLMLLYGANGMTDGMMCAIAVATIDNLTGYMKTDRLTDLVKAGSWLAAEFMTRYESVPIGFGIGLGLAIMVYKRDKIWARAEAMALMFWFPVICAGVTWMLLNWMIMGSPLYFANSRYSNSVQISSGHYNTPAVVAARHNIVVSLSEVVHFTLLFWPYMIVAGIVLVLSFFRHNDRIGLPILLGSLGAPALQAFLLYTHRSADWDRFFIYYIPFGLMLSAYLVSQIPSAWRGAAALTSVLLLVSADITTLQTLRSPVWGNGDNWAVNKIYGSQGSAVSNAALNTWSAIQNSANTGRFINAHPNLKVIISSFTSYGVIPFIKNPNQIVITSDTNFKAVLLNPRGRVNAFLVSPFNAFTKASDIITATYPTMWQGGVSWTRLIRQFPDGSRLYAVLPDAP